MKQTDISRKTSKICQMKILLSFSQIRHLNMISDVVKAYTNKNLASFLSLNFWNTSSNQYDISCSYVNH